MKYKCSICIASSAFSSKVRTSELLLTETVKPGKDPWELTLGYYSILTHMINITYVAHHHMRYTQD